MLFASFLVDLLTTLLVHPSFPVVRPSGTASGVYLGYLSWCEVGRTIVSSIFALKFSAHCMLYLSLAIWKVPTSAPNLLHSSAWLSKWPRICSHTFLQQEGAVGALCSRGGPCKEEAEDGSWKARTGYLRKAAKWHIPEWYNIIYEREYANSWLLAIQACAQAFNYRCLSPVRILVNTDNCLLKVGINPALIVIEVSALFHT